MSAKLSFRKQAIKTTAFIASIFLSSVLLSGCLKDDKNKNAHIDSFDLTLNLPKSLTGTQSTQVKPAAKGSVVAHNNPDNEFANCDYVGPEDEDIFKNGYNMTQFMVSAVASWTCIGDILINIGSLLPANGNIQTTEHNADEPNYDPEEPTHFKVSKNKDSTSISLYYGYGHSQPLPDNATPGFYIVWQKNGNITTGKMLIDANAINNPARDDDDPTQVRMDFNYNETQKHADMYMVFDEGNPWAEGFRIQVIKDLTAAPTQQVYTARGKIDTTGQYADVDGITEIPVFDLYTVSDAAGKGAAHAEFTDLGLSLKIDIDSHLGDYLVNKQDTYFFDENSDWDWIEKSFTDTELRGSQRNLNANELDSVEAFLGLPNDYFDTTCDVEFAECNALINSIFEDGFYGQEANQGADPNDWRSTALDNITYLESVYPAGNTSWDGVFAIE